jgi:uncharacterized protein (DUF433 family)
MSQPLTIDPLPVQMDKEGVLRVGGTRVTLDTVVHAFKRGAAAEEIASQYSAIDLADVYGAISYYLRHRAEVERYLEKRAREAEEIRREVEARCDPRGIRERLLARRASQGS